MPTRLLIVGSGSLGSVICHALAGLASVPVAVTVAARDRARAAQLCHTAGVTARLAGRPVSFTPLTVEVERPDGPAEMLRQARPAGVVLCASPQSPWEAARARSAWTDLLSRAGFGLTLPLQAELAVRLARCEADAWLVNACLPDAVNPLLAAVAAPARCGVGNVGTLAAGLQHALGLPDQSRLRLLAHHVHLRPPQTPGDEARAWLDDAPLAGVGDLLAPHRATGRQALNQITGYAAAQVLDALITGAELATHLPGPLGLPGGYPVLLRDGRPRLRLPADLTQPAAVLANQRAALRDGVLVSGARVVFGPACAAALGEHLPELARGFPVGDVSAACRELLRLRDRLRTRPAHTAPAGARAGGPREGRA
jgi:hypothetical protein